MTPEQQTMINQHYAKVRFNAMFRRAWFEIAQERGYRYDSYLGTSSHGTIGLRIHLSSLGL